MNHDTRLYIPDHSWSLLATEQSSHSFLKRDAQGVCQSYWR